MSLKVDPKVEEALDNLIDALVNTKEYEEYQKQKEKLESDPDLRGKLKRMREIRYQLSALSDNDRNNDFAERLETEYEDLSEETKVYDYSAAELKICDMYKMVTSKVVAAMEPIYLDD